MSVKKQYKNCFGHTGPILATEGFAMFQSNGGEMPDLFDRLCDRLDMLSSSDVADNSRPFALVYGESHIEWFVSFKDAARSARDRFDPETYAIGSPVAPPEYVPMVFVHQAVAS
jgi:hypothetical protein